MQMAILKSQKAQESAKGKFKLNDNYLISWVIIPGMFMLSKTTMAVVYFLVLSYLFMGIAIVSDIFMEAIEGITAQT